MNLIQRSAAAVFVAGGLLAAGLASASQCPTFYVDGRAPEILNPKMEAATTELCYGVFGVMHSGITRTPLWSAEYLKLDNLEAAGKLIRRDTVTIQCPVDLLRTGGPTYGPRSACVR